MKIFRLIINEHDRRTSFPAQYMYLIGSLNISDDEFQFLCSGLIPEAARQAILVQQKSERPELIGIIQIINSLVDLLSCRGFSRVEHASASFTGEAVYESCYESFDQEDLTNHLFGVEELLYRFNEQVFVDSFAESLGEPLESEGNILCTEESNPALKTIPTAHNIVVDPA